jgi:hypothetical protein
VTFLDYAKALGVVMLLTLALCSGVIVAAVSDALRRDDRGRCKCCGGWLPR